MSETISPATTPLCNAPYTVMDFDPAGNVTACCVNAMYPIGQVGRATLREIWDGPRVRRLREGVMSKSLGPGCGICRHRLTFDAGDPATWYYDRFGVTSLEPEWPRVMAFALGNTCNAACIMCGGDLSSKIRSQREGRAPLVSPYGERFFGELEEFVPHLAQAEFRGGEPFLIRAHDRVFDLLIDTGNETPCHFTTNGTIWNAKVERVIDALPSTFTVSIDGISAEVNEAVRVGVDHATLLANIPRFLDYTRSRPGTRMELSCCLLQQNWWEVPDLFRFAEDLGVRLCVQPVLDRHFGLHRLGDDDLRDVRSRLGREGTTLEPSLGDENRQTWGEVLGWLDQEIAQRAHGEPLRIAEFPDETNATHVEIVMRRARREPGTVGSDAPPAPANGSDGQGPDDAPLPPRRRWRQVRERLLARSRPAGSEPDSRGGDAAAEDARHRVSGWTGVAETGLLRVGADGKVTAADIDAVIASVPGTTGVPALDGRPVADALRAIADAVNGPHLWVLDEAHYDGCVEHTMFMSPTRYRDKTGLVLRTLTIADPDTAGATLVALSADDVFLATPRGDEVTGSATAVVDAT